MKIKLRPAVGTDHAFIYATYIRNRWFDKENKTTLKRSTWSSLQHQRLETILSNGLVIVACLDEDEDCILGYVFMDQGKPYSYIKLDWRSDGLGVKEKLLKEIT
jgi:hypothetical protein